MDTVRDFGIYNNVSLALRTVLTLSPLKGLYTLRDAFNEDRVVRNYYTDEGNGCLLHWLTGVTKKPELLSCGVFDESTVVAAIRVMRCWDTKTLAEWTVLTALRRELAARGQAAAITREPLSEPLVTAKNKRKQSSHATAETNPVAG